MTTIKHRYSGAVLHEGPGTLREQLQKAIASNSDLSDSNLSRADLRDSDLRNANLRGCDLSGANLRYANLRYAKLRDCDLRGADLRNANLRGCDLRGADLRYANLRYAKLRGCDLSGADLRNANLRGCDLSGAKNIICLPIGDPRGYRPVAVWFGDHWIIYSGCRRFTIEESLAHWGAGYKGERSTGDQYLAAMDWLEAQQVPVDDSKEAS